MFAVALLFLAPCQAQVDCNWVQCVRTGTNRSMHLPARGDPEPLEAPCDTCTATFMSLDGLNDYIKEEMASNSLIFANGTKLSSDDRKTLLINQTLFGSPWKTIEDQCDFWYTYTLVIFSVALGLWTLKVCAMLMNEYRYGSSWYETYMEKQVEMSDTRFMDTDASVEEAPSKSKKISRRHWKSVSLYNSKIKWLFRWQFICGLLILLASIGIGFAFFLDSRVYNNNNTSGNENIMFKDMDETSELYSVSNISYLSHAIILAMFSTVGVVMMANAVGNINDLLFWVTLLISWVVIGLAVYSYSWNVEDDQDREVMSVASLFFIGAGFLFPLIASFAYMMHDYFDDRSVLLCTSSSCEHKMKTDGEGETVTDVSQHERIMGKGSIALRWRMYSFVVPAIPIFVGTILMVTLQKKDSVLPSLFHHDHLAATPYIALWFFAILWLVFTVLLLLNTFVGLCSFDAHIANFNMQRVTTLVWRGTMIMPFVAIAQSRQRKAKARRESRREFEEEAALMSYT